MGTSAPPQTSPSGPGAGAPPPVLPGGLGHIARPTERPGEHVMTGVAVGPGAGPEAIPGFNPGGQQQNVSQVLDGLANQPFASPEVKNLAAYVKSGKA